MAGEDIKGKGKGKKEQKVKFSKASDSMGFVSQNPFLITEKQSGFVSHSFNFPDDFFEAYVPKASQHISLIFPFSRNEI